MSRSATWRLSALGAALLGCSSIGSCSSCGVSAIPGGFPNVGEIENAASLRVTHHGLTFVQSNIGAIATKLGAGSFTFPIGPSTTDLIIASAQICQSPTSTQCIADINAPGIALTLTPAGPHDLQVSGTLPVKVADLPVLITTLANTSCTIDVGIGSNLSCVGNTPVVDYVNVPFAVDLSIEADPNQAHSRYGFSLIRVVSVNATIDPSIVEFCGSFCAGVANALKSTIVTQITNPLQDQIKSQIESQLCQQANPNVTPDCPNGSNNVNNVCRYGTLDTDACLPILIGTEGRLDVGSFLASISSGTAGKVDFVLAGGGPDKRPDGSNFAFGDMNPIANGMSLGMTAGALPAPQSSCVTKFDNPVPTGIPTPDELLQDTQTPWPQGDNGPDLGVALAGRYLNYAFGNVYNSGALCLGVSTDQFVQLQSGLLSVLIPSIKRLSFEQKPAAVAITTRPQSPPVAKLGGGTDIKTDPLLLVTLPQFALDFYVWSDDRYVRAFTFTSDVSIPINLSTHVDANNPNGGILPSLGSIGIQNPSVTNADLLVDDPNAIASGLGPVLGGIVSQFLGNFAPIDLSKSLASLGVGLTIPDGGIRKLTKGADDFLAIFADLSLAANAVQQADVQARIVSKKVFPEAMSLTTADRAKSPTLSVTFSSSLDDGTRSVEYAYAIDHGAHSEWKTGRDRVLQDDGLFLQGKHTLSVWARVHGQMLSESAQPAVVPFVIDVLPPSLDLTMNSNGSLHVDAWDIVSGTTIQMRTREVDGAEKSAWSDWRMVSDIGATASAIEVEVRDEEGNIGSSSSALIRGRPDPTLAASGGCGGCTVGATRATFPWSGLMLAALALLRRRRQISRSS